MKYLNLRFIIAWALTVFVSWFVMGFLESFYNSFVEVLLLTLLVQSLLGTILPLIAKKAEMIRLSHSVDFIFLFVLGIGLLIFAWRMFGMLNQFPQLFDAKYVLLEPVQFFPFFISSALSLPCLVYLEGKDVFQKYFSFINNSLLGLSISGIFFAIYFQIAVTFNQPAFDVDDIFFDTDGLLWRTRFTTDAVQDYYWRSVHPFVLILIRPLVGFLSLFLKSDKLVSVILLIALTGAVCVFLVWYFVKFKTYNSLYAVLIASLFGASAAQLVFSSLIETYIFLAVIALLFVVLLLKNSPFFLLIITGVASFGITLSNFVQHAIAFIFIKRDFVGWVKFGVLVGIFVIPLTLLNNFIYPDSQPYFFDPTSLNAEAENTFSPSVLRALAVARVISLHSIVAPDPLLLQEEIPFIKVWIFKAEPMRLSEYGSVFGNSLAFIWLALCLLGVFLFVKNFRTQDNRFSLTFILILIFNFLLHLRYGKDLFLYSANWTYAIVLFLSMAWAELSNKRWFQITLLIFIFLLLANNFRLIDVMLHTSAEHIK